MAYKPLNVEGLKIPDWVMNVTPTSFQDAEESRVKQLYNELTTQRLQRGEDEAARAEKARQELQQIFTPTDGGEMPTLESKLPEVQRALIQSGDLDTALKLAEEIRQQRTRSQSSLVQNMNSLKGIAQYDPDLASRMSESLGVDNLLGGNVDYSKFEQPYVARMKMKNGEIVGIDRSGRITTLRGGGGEGGGEKQKPGVVLVNAVTGDRKLGKKTDLTQEMFNQGWRYESGYKGDLPEDPSILDMQNQLQQAEESKDAGPGFLDSILGALSNVKQDRRDPAAAQQPVVVRRKRQFSSPQQSPMATQPTMMPY